MLSFKKLLEDKYLAQLQDEIQGLVDENPQLFGLVHYERNDVSKVTINKSDLKCLIINDSSPDEVDLIMQIKLDCSIETDNGNINRWTPWANISGLCKITESEIELGKCEYGPYKKIQAEKPLDDYLVPVMDSEAMERVALYILETYYPEVLTGGSWLDPKALAARLGLTILEIPLYGSLNHRGQVYFKDSEHSYIEDEEEKSVQIKSGTLLVDNSLLEDMGEGAYNFTIVHECVHWVLHQKAAFIANIIHSNLISRNLTFEGEKHTYSYLETQANKIASYMMVPKQICLDKVNISQKNFETILKSPLFENFYSELEDVHRIEWVVEDISTAFNVSRTTTKLRLIDLGFAEAMGVFNYIDGRYIPGYSFSKGAITKQETFSIRYQDFIDLLKTNEKFLQDISIDEFVFVDNHVVKFDDKFVFENDDGVLELTNYALLHIDECCLKFDVKVISSYLNDYNLYNSGVLYHKRGIDLTFEVYYSDVQEEKSDYLISQLDEIYILKSSLPNNLPGAVNKIMEYYSYNQEAMAEMCDLSDRKLRELKSNDEVSPTLETMMQFCLGLKLPPLISFTLIEIAGHKFTSSWLHTTYQFILSGYHGKGLHECNKMLVSMNIKPLGRADRDYFQSIGTLNSE